MRLDSRPILVDRSGIRLSKVEVSKGISLCIFCSDQTHCPIRTPEQIERCEHYVPAFSFSPAATRGLVGDFSTFRSSRVWAERASVTLAHNAKVGLFNTGTGEIISYARITKVITGPFNYLMNEHAHTNHLVIANSIPKHDAPVWLAKEIRRIAGARYVKSDHQISAVIYVSTEKAAKPP